MTMDHDNIYYSFCKHETISIKAFHYLAVYDRLWMQMIRTSFLFCIKHTENSHKRHIQLFVLIETIGVAIISYFMCSVDKQCLKSQRCRSGQCRGAKPDGDRCAKTSDCFQGSFCKVGNVCRADDPIPALSVMIFVICILLSISVTLFLIYRYRYHKKLSMKKDSDSISLSADEHKRKHSTQTLDIPSSYQHEKPRTILVETPDTLIQPPFIISLTSPPQRIRSKHHPSNISIQKNTA